MATRAQAAANDGVATAPEIVDEVLAIPVARIKLGERMRPIDPDHAEALASIMGRDGQNTPIEVCRLPGRPTWQLVAGAHRLAAAKILGWVTIKSVVVTVEGAERRLREISENLFRRELDPLDRAAFVAELYELEKARSGLAADEAPQAAGASARWQKVVAEQAADATATIAVAYGFTDRVADALRLSVRTVRDDLTLHRGLPPALVAQLRGLPIAANAGQLRALAKLPEADQRAVVGLIGEGKAKGVSDARAILENRIAPTAETKAWSAFFGGWGRMTARQRRDALRELAELGLPKGVSLQFEGDADA